jgi:hypothetical protein
VKSVMLQSAYTFPWVDSIKWDKSERPPRVMAMPNLDEPLAGSGNSLYPNICKYALRDRQLAYRDLIVAGALAEISMLSSTVWGSYANRLIIPAIPSNVLWNEPEDRSTKNTVVASGTTGSGNGTTTFTESTPSFEASHVGKTLFVNTVGTFHIVDVTSSTSIVLNGPAPSGVYEWEIDASFSQISFVNNSSRPVDAIYTDKDLYTRDVLVYEALARLCLIFDMDIRPIESLDPVVDIGNSWAHAGGTESPLDVSVSALLNRSLFVSPDKNLAHRDNILANHVSRLNRYLYNIFGHAHRLYTEIKVANTREPEVYHLVLDTAYQRIWQAEPFIPTRAALVYDKTNNTLQWRTEDGTEEHVPQDVNFGLPNVDTPNPLVFDGVDTGQKIEVIPDIPQAKDVQWLRQKGRRLKLGSSYERNFVYSESTSSICSTYPIVNQFGSASLTSPGSLSFEIDPVEDGDYRLFMFARPSGDVILRGADNVEKTGGVSYGVDYPAVGSAYQWYVNLPPLSAPHTWSLTFRYTNLTQAVASMAAIVTWNGNPVSFVCHFSTTPGRLVTSSQLVLPVGSSPVAGTVKIQLVNLGGGGQFHIRDLRINSSADTPDYFLFTCEMGGQTKVSNIFGKRDRPDVLEFPFQGVTGLPTRVNFSWTNLNGMSLRIPAIELRKVDSQTPTLNVGHLHGWHAELLDRVHRKVHDSYRSSQESYLLAPEFREINAPVNQLWTYQVRQYGLDGFSSVNEQVTLTSDSGKYSVGDEIVFYADNLAPVRASVVSIDSTDKLTKLRLNKNIVLGTATGVCEKVSDSPVFSAVGLPNGVTIDSLTGYITGTPAPSSIVGIYPIDITAAKSGVEYKMSFSLNVLELPANSNTWTKTSTEGWMNSLEVTEPRLRQAFRIGRPGDVGRQAIIPEGLEFTYSGERCSLDSVRSSPSIRIFQPWMLDAGIYVFDPIDDLAQLAQVETPSITLYIQYFDEIIPVDNEVYEYNRNSRAAISCATPDAVIRYTTDGSEPTESSTAYSSTFQSDYVPKLPPDYDQAFIKAKAYKEGMEPSETAVLPITPAKAISVTVNPPTPPYGNGAFVLCLTKTDNYNEHHLFFKFGGTAVKGVDYTLDVFCFSGSPVPGVNCTETIGFGDTCVLVYVYPVYPVASPKTLTIETDIGWPLAPYRIGSPSSATMDIGFTTSTTSFGISSLSDAPVYGSPDEIIRMESSLD